MSDLNADIERALHGRKGKRRGDEIDFLCVSHDQSIPGPASWNAKRGVWNCLSCGDHGNTEDLARKLGIAIPEKEKRDEWQEIAHWDFTDEAGTVLFRHVKFLVGGKKRFQFWRPDGKGGWIKNREGVKSVLYKLPELAALKPGDLVLICEGEKDADTAIAHGFNATSTPDGAQERGKNGRPAQQRWYGDRYNRSFAGLDVVVVPDNDTAGRDFGNAVAGSLRGAARSLRVLRITEGLAPRADLTDWFNDGGSAADLLAAIKAAPEWEPPEEPKGAAGFPLTDAGNGELFAHLYGDRVRYDWLRGRWLVWGRHRWQPDPNGELHRLAKQAARERWKAAADEDSERREAIAKWAIASESAGKLTAAIDRARSEPPIADDGEGWDSHPMLFACANGVINLVTGELRPGKPEDRITMGSPIRYDPEAQCPRFLRFLEEIHPDEAMREFMRLWLGLCMTGVTREQVWVLAYGTGANGKGTLMDTIKYVLGDYCGVMAFSTIERGKEQSIPSDMAALQGKRLVITSETQENSRFNEARIKSLTGEDAITARELYQRQFTFQPQLKLMVAVNNKPVVQDDSYGFWRRMRAAPFTTQFGPDTWDDNLREKLKEEAEGILAWLVRGAIEWGKRGLPVPPAVALATVEYREESDVFGAFIRERCIEMEGAWVQANSFYKAFKAWSEAEGVRERDMMSATTFGRRMGERYKKRVMEGKRRFMGIGLIADGWTKPSPAVRVVEPDLDSAVRVEGLGGISFPAPYARTEDFPENPHQPSPTLTGAENDDCPCDTCGCPDENTFELQPDDWHCNEHHPISDGDM